MQTKRVSRGGQCGYKRGPLQQCRRRTRTLVLIQAHKVPAIYMGHQIGEDVVQTHWEHRCVSHREISNGR